MSLREIPGKVGEFDEDWRVVSPIIHRVRKKRVWSISGITSSNTDQFLKFFQCYNLQKI